MSADGCGAPAGGVSVTAATGSQAVVEGRVVHEGSPVATGYARLLGTGDEFVAEVPLGEDGGFRFFAAPGSWTLRVLAPGGLRAERSVQADYGQGRDPCAPSRRAGCPPSAGCRPTTARSRSGT